MKSASRHGFHDGHTQPSAPPVHAPRLDEPTPFETLVREMLVQLGEDPAREGLRQTPDRVEASLRWLTRGYQMSVADVIGDALYHERHENLVCVRDIEIYSLCEHHMLPFFGRAHVAYLPNGRLVGLSKIPRVIEVFARRLQVQERLTDQVADALMEVLDPRGVGVVIEAYHLCMMMRGVEKQNSKTVTSALRGALLQDAKTRDEFLRLVYSGRGSE
ncbi:MAG TPA: GTP cyclohydrolase I FolE [Gemmatimonadales bacterium]|nr:GTP cyclohydrolase I FolE [Gemmatimonadales bacterium]